MPDPDTWRVFDEETLEILQADVSDQKSANFAAIPFIEDRYRATRLQYLIDNPVIGRTQREREIVRAEIEQEARDAAAVEAQKIKIEITP